ncbi:PHP domain-containing protein [Sinorhizobium fredii]|uniref:PHP domain-containing protein n=1 Tax=Rhizobium fredii TaxID=380 RepID=UPI000A6B261E
MAGNESIGQGAAGVDPQFVHLRVHSAFSLLEGALPLKKIIAKAVADEQPAIGIADTNNLFAALEFSQKAADDGLQPIIGCQLAIDMEDEAEGERRSHAQQLAKLPSIVLIAATDAGYTRLVDLVSRAYLEGEGHQAVRITRSWLVAGGTDGLIALTGPAVAPSTWR